MGSAEEREHAPAGYVERADPARVPLDGGGQEAGQVRDGEVCGGGAQRVDGGYPPRPQDDRDVMPVDPGSGGEFCGCRRC
jgi:hypothetical protein